MAKSDLVTSMGVTIPFLFLQATNCLRNLFSLDLIRESTGNKVYLSGSVISFRLILYDLFILLFVITQNQRNIKKVRNKKSDYWIKAW